MSDKYISRDNLELAIDGLKVGMTPNWNENDKSAVGYIENRPFYTDGDIVHQLDEKYIPDGIARMDSVNVYNNNILEILEDNKANMLVLDNNGPIALAPTGYESVVYGNGIFVGVS